MPEELYNLIYNKALDLISRREHSLKEIKDKLRLRYNEADTVEEVVDKLISNNLVNNLRFTEFYVISRKRKGFGPKKISYELLNKGINESISNEVILNEGGWKTAATKAFNKKFKQGPSQDFKIRQKQKNFLQNRGFGFKEIESVFTNHML